MFKKIVSLLLIYTVFLLSSFSVKVFGQTQTQVIDLRSPSEEISSKNNLKELFAEETAKAKSEKSFTKENADRLQKESLNQTAKKNNFSMAAKVGVGVGIAAAVILIIVLATRDDDSSSPGNVQCVRAPCP